MAFLDMFDKLDDIVYEPVKVICEWAKEPLHKWERKHEIEKMQKTAELEAEAKKLEQELAQKAQRESAELDADIRRWNAEIDEMIADKEMERHDRLVESLKKYQLDLANAIMDIVENLNSMSIEIRKQAIDLITDKTKEFCDLKQDVRKQADARMAEIARLYANNERVRIRMEDSILDDMDQVITEANKLIHILAEDMKQLIANSDEMERIGWDTIQKYVSPLAQNSHISMAPTSLQGKIEYEEIKKLK